MLSGQDQTILLYQLSQSRERAANYVAHLDRQISVLRERGIIEEDSWLVAQTPADVVPLLIAEIGDKEQENMVVLLLNGQGEVMAVETVYIGSAHTCSTRTGELFKEAVRRNAIAIIVAHNHPSGNPTPSPEDIKVTEQMVAAGLTLDIQVLDHIVVGRNKWISMKAHGMGFGDERGDG